MTSWPLVDRCQGVYDNSRYTKKRDEGGQENGKNYQKIS